MRLRNEVNKIGVNINQIVKNNNSQFYRKDDKMNLISQIAEIKSIVQILTEKLLN